VIALLWRVRHVKEFQNQRQVQQISTKVGRKQTRFELLLQRLEKGDYMTNQNHFTLSFPLKSPADAKALSE
jgi:hypothetical protein